MEKKKREEEEEGGGGAFWLCQTVLRGNILFSARHKNNENHLSLGNDGTPSSLPCTLLTVPGIERKWCGSQILQKFTQTSSRVQPHGEKKRASVRTLCALVRLRVLFLCVLSAKPKKCVTAVHLACWDNNLHVF